MTKQEFEERVTRPVSEKEYKIVEKVYTWHPSISETDGKNQMVMLFETFGMDFIRGMEEAADWMMNLDKEEREIRAKLKEVEKRKRMVAMGNMQYERCNSGMMEEFQNTGSITEWEEKVSMFGSIYGTDTVLAVREAQGF